MVDFTPPFPYTKDMKKSTSAFTIIELIAVISIIAVLAAVTIVAYSGVQARARDATRRADIGNIVKALEQYYDDYGSYPDPTGTASVISTEWYSSGDASWGTFGTSLASIIDATPKDPKGIANANPLNANEFAYAYFTGANCGKSSGQWYLLVYRFESSANEKFTDGDCSTNPIGDTYFAGGASYYRSVK